MTSSDNEHAVYPWRGDHVDFAYILEFIGVKEADYLARFSNDSHITYYTNVHFTSDFLIKIAETLI